MAGEETGASRESEGIEGRRDVATTGIVRSLARNARSRVGDSSCSRRIARDELARRLAFRVAVTTRSLEMHFSLIRA